MRVSSTVRCWRCCTSTDGGDGGDRRGGVAHGRELGEEDLPPRIVEQFVGQTSARRVLPTPPGPVRVTRRCPRSCVMISSSSSSRPTSPVVSTGGAGPDALRRAAGEQQRRVVGEPRALRARGTRATVRARARRAKVRRARSRPAMLPPIARSDRRDDQLLPQAFAQRVARQPVLRGRRRAPRDRRARAAPRSSPRGPSPRCSPSRTDSRCAPVVLNELFERGSCQRRAAAQAPRRAANWGWAAASRARASSANRPASMRSSGTCNT